MSELEEIDKLNKKIATRMDRYLGRSFERNSLAYTILADYPSRPGKGLRPNLCLTACGAVGGDIENALNTATAIELLHNSFLIKDDIVDRSEFRRGEITLNRKFGFEFAINAGDALKVLSLTPLIDNMEELGVKKALQLIQEIQWMASKSVEGQIIELSWVNQNVVDLKFEDYYDMVTRKTCWYTCITPCRTGLIIGLEEVSKDQLDVMTRFGTRIGIGFQIRDDVLNLISTFQLYGKEINGDIREGKRTLILIHLFNSVANHEKEKIARILKKPREQKTDQEVLYIRKLMDRYSSIEKSMRVSKSFAMRARRILETECEWMTNMRWKDFFFKLTDYMIDRKR